MVLGDGQELTITDFSFPGLLLAPGPSIPSLPKASGNLFLHVLSSSLESSVSSSFFFYFFLSSDFSQKLLVCFAVPSSYHLTSLILIAKLLKQVDSMCRLTFVSDRLPAASDLLARTPLPFHGGSVVFCLPNTSDRLPSGCLCAVLL